MIKKKILIICPYPEGQAAGQRLKYEQYFDYWKLKNYELTVSSYFGLKAWKILYKPGFFFNKFLSIIYGNLQRIKEVFLLNQYDVIYIFMYVTPLGSTFFERLFRMFGKKIIYDFDDSIHLKENYKYHTSLNPFVGFFKRPNKSKYLIKYSNHVIISSPFHYEYCYKFNKYKSCTYIPCSLNTNYFFPLKKNISFQKTINIGWTGTFSSRQYLDSIRNALIRLNKITKFNLIIIGNFEYSIPGINVQLIEWNKEYEIQDLQKIDIGIYPLIKNNWTLGKGGLKAIQFMALEIPTVATDFGNTSNVIKNNVSGILVNNEDEWISSLTYLINNPKERLRLGQNARKEIIKNFSLEALKSKYQEILDRISH